MDGRPADDTLSILTRNRPRNRSLRPGDQFSCPILVNNSSACRRQFVASVVAAGGFEDILAKLKGISKDAYAESAISIRSGNRLRNALNAAVVDQHFANQLPEASLKGPSKDPLRFRCIT
jgi:hypothetical protein